MKILFVSEYFYPRQAGGEVWSWELCTALAKRGHKVTVITTRQKGLKRSETKNKVKILRPILNTKNTRERMIREINNFRLSRYVKRNIRKNKYDIIHMMAYGPTVWLSKFIKKNKIPSITSVHSYFGKDWKYFLKTPILLIRAERNTLKKDASEYIHIPSEYLKKRISREIGVELQKKLFVIHNWLPEKFPDAKPLQKNTYLFVGSLEPVKNPLACIDAAKKNKAHLLVIGEGSLRDKMEDIAHNKKVQCTFLGNTSREETLAYIGGASLVLVPSFSESFSLVALEAVAQGTPVSGNPVGILPELPGVVKFPPKKTPQRLSETVQQEVREKFSKERAIDEFEKLYQKALR